MPSIDWSDDVQRRHFEEELKDHRDIKKNYSWPQWLVWFTGIFLFPASLVMAFYGPVAYVIVNEALRDKFEKEEAMQLQWLELTQANLTEGAQPPDFVYNDTMNVIKRNFYFLTVPCQGIAYLCAVVHHYTDYKKWNSLGKVIATLCLPVDVLIFYIEPLGFVGTLTSMVLGFIPFEITVADAIFPEKVVKIKSQTDNIIIVRKNSWISHISAKYNERYWHVMKILANGYNAFATLALVITLLKGENVIKTFDFYLHNKLG